MNYEKTKKTITNLRSVIDNVPDSDIELYADLISAYDDALEALDIINEIKEVVPDCTCVDGKGVKDCPLYKSKTESDGDE